MEVNNLVSSMLQDYAYIMKGSVYDENGENAVAEIIIKIPIGHVSVVGIYKGVV